MKYRLLLSNGETMSVTLHTASELSVKDGDIVLVDKRGLTLLYVPKGLWLYFIAEEAVTISR